MDIDMVMVEFFIDLAYAGVIGFAIGNFLAFNKCHRRLRQMIKLSRSSYVSHGHERNMGYLTAVGDLMLTEKEFLAKRVISRMVADLPIPTSGPATLSSTASLHLGRPQQTG